MKLKCGNDYVRRFCNITRPSLYEGLISRDLSLLQLLVSSEKTTNNQFYLRFSHLHAYPVSIIDCGEVATICSGGDWGHWPLVHKNHASSMPF